MRFLCIHGHFYQPTRENPWTGLLERADPAAPYHDWNDRITAECYARNASSRLLDDAGRITRIVNNYARISFNVGCTLAGWLDRYAPATYALMLDADRQSRHTQYGHGNAIAQVYNHLIMPLANVRDRATQVRWGIRDFERRFGRAPEGMWLPETAVDVATLEVLAAEGIAFTILAPHQARRIRRGGGSWTDVSSETLDVTRPYRCRLPNGRAIALFFYHQPISHAVAFEGLLHDGKAFADRLTGALPRDQRARILLVASDGETYGHHHQFGDMALAYALERVGQGNEISLTNPAAFLAAHPPTAEVEIAERTSWSCAHGIERWRADCGCNTGKGWHQRWRGPLREAMTHLVEQCAALFESQGSRLFRDPWAARDEAIDLLDASPGSVEGFLSRHGTDVMTPARHVEALRLLELQRQAMLMQSSDGWFFDDISGPETVQILSHAARAVDLARVLGLDVENHLREILRNAPGNLERYPDGAAVYDQLARSRAVGTHEATAYHAMTSLAGTTSSALGADLTVTEVERKDAPAGPHTLRIGRVHVHDRTTADEGDAAYALVHFGGPDVHCTVATKWDEEHYASVRASLLEQSTREGLSEVVRAMDRAFGPRYFTLRDLPVEDRREVLGVLSEQTVRDLEDVYRRLYQENRPFMEYLRAADAAIPPALITAAVVALTRDLEALLSDPAASLHPRAGELLAELRFWGREILAERFEPLLRNRLERALQEAGVLRDRAHRAAEVLDFADAAGITLNLWEAQNAWYDLALHASAASGAGLGTAHPDPALRQLGERLHFTVDKIE